VARLSIIIPALGPTEPFEATLASVLANRPDDCDIVVTHAGSYGDPYDLAGEVNFVELPPGTGLVECLNLSLLACDSDFVHLLASGTEVEEGWTEPALVHFHQPLVAAVSPLVLAQRGGEVVSAGVAYGWGGSRQVCRGRSTIEDVEGPSWTAGFYRLAALEAVGGFDAEMGETAADLDLALTLRRVGYRCEVEPECHIYAPATAVAAAQGFAAGREQQRLFWRHAPAAGWLSSSVLHPLTVAGEVLGQLGSWTALTQLAGRIAGWCESGVGGRYAQKLATLARPEPIIEPARPRTISLAAARQEAAKRTTVPAARKRAA
jgi:hypothetical protein